MTAPFKLHLLALVFCVVAAGCDCSTPPTNTDASVGGGDGSTGGGSASTGGGSASTGGGSAIGGGDGGVIVDPNDPGNSVKDSDCDGLSDADEFGDVYPGGKRTNPANPDTDGDGIKDGVEAGRLTSPDPSCTYVGDADPTSRTNPTQADSDGDGIDDGIEDANHNGRAEPTETDATNPDTDFDNLNDGVEDVNHNGTVDTSETDPRKKDTDGDFINDGIELSVTKTDPLNPDSDGDTCRDGAEDANQNGKVDPGETDPHLATDCGAANNPDTDGDGLTNKTEDKNLNGKVDPGETDPNNPDTDGDGLKDGIEDANKNGVFEAGETNPLSKDTDCDGLADGPNLAAGVLGEDLNSNGVVDIGETDPRKRDTDGDGITDGVEKSVTASILADPPHCTNVPVDTDPTTHTNPNSADTDGDGINDGAEDTNQNGKVDPGELDPNNPNDGMGPAGKVCTVMNLRPVAFKSDAEPDLSLGLPAGFTEVTTMSVGGLKKGLIGYDATTKVAFVAWKQAAPVGSTTPTTDETALRVTLNGVGALSNDTTQTFTSWDGIAAVQAFYTQAGTTDLKAQANAIANAMVGAGAGALTGTAGTVGPFKLQVEYLHRSDTSVMVVVALTPLASYAAAPLFAMTDTAGGSGVAQFGDANAYQCETFAPKAGSVDFLMVVDDSCSMGNSQQALADAASAMNASLSNSTLDWRVTMVSTSYHQTGAQDCNSGGRFPTFYPCDNASIRRGFSRSIGQFRAWLTTNSKCSNGTCNTVPAPLPACESNLASEANGANGGCWIGIAGSGYEGSLGAARKALDDITSAALPTTEVVNSVRANTQVAVILLGDADDQTTGYTSAGIQKNWENVNNFITFFSNSGAGTKNKLGMKIPVHGIVCPAGADCNQETQGNPQRHGQVITATGGVRGAINDSTSIQTTIAAIVNSTIGAAGYKMQKPPIGASVKVAMDAVLDGTKCNKDDIPRSRADGFDFDGINRTISFFGACRPSASTTKAAVSYRYWVDTTVNPNGNPPPCSNDTYYDPTDPDFCKGKLACNLTSNTCECPADCGSTSPPAGKVCDTNRLVCDFVCTSDCGGTCSPYQQCNVASCGCECKQTASCPLGFKFQNGAGVCGCVCDTAALNCGPTYDANATSCTCVCKANCGGCDANQTCNSSTCSCTGGIN